MLLPLLLLVLLTCKVPCGTSVAFPFYDFASAVAKTRALWLGWGISQQETYPSNELAFVSCLLPLLLLPFRCAPPCKRINLVQGEIFVSSPRDYWCQHAIILGIVERWRFLFLFLFLFPFHFSFDSRACMASSVRLQARIDHANKTKKPWIRFRIRLIYLVMINVAKY